MLSLVEAFLRFFSRIMSRQRKSRRRPLDHHTKAIYSQRRKGLEDYESGVQLILFTVT
jgi:hypothetical protein